MTDEPKRIIFLGAITVDDDKMVAFDFPADASPEAIREALIAAEAERVEAQIAESRRRREMFLRGAADEQ
jgi:hypothetical protein